VRENIAKSLQNKHLLDIGPIMDKEERRSSKSKTAKSHGHQYVSISDVTCYTAFASDILSLQGSDPAYVTASAPHPQCCQLHHSSPGWDLDRVTVTPVAKPMRQHLLTKDSAAQVEAAIATKLKQIRESAEYGPEIRAQYGRTFFFTNAVASTIIEGTVAYNLLHDLPVPKSLYIDTLIKQPVIQLLREMAEFQK
jgi:hypothetical protein